jgi:coenzyme PQQ synthesis protein D (PqqD)
MGASEPDDRAMLSGRVRVREHVVYRDFADETVILNLESGMYHGLNTTAAKMLETLDSGVPVSEAIDSLATEFGQPRDVIERDVLALCRALVERGLIARDAGGDQS